MTTSVAVKPPCRVQTTAAITLSGEQTVNGVAVVTGDRVLVKDQASSVDNGIYIADTSAWSRAPDFDGSLDAVDGTLVLVHAASGPDQIYELSATNPVIIGTSALTFSLSSLTTTAFGASLIAAVDAAAARLLLGFSTFFSTLIAAADAAALRLLLLIPSRGEIQAQTYTAFTTTGTSTAYVGAPSPAITAYVAGQSFWVTFDEACGNAPTLEISGVATPPNLVKQIADGTYVNVAANDIPINHRSRVTLLSATQALVDLPAAGKYITSLPSLTAGGLPDSSVLTADIADGNVTPAKLSQPLTSGTAQAASGTSVNFTGIPSWAKQITLSQSGVSTSGASQLFVQIGDAGGLETSGYLGGYTTLAGSVASGVATTGFSAGNAGSSAAFYNGSMVLTLVDSATNTWSAEGSFYQSDAAQGHLSAGSKALSATLDRISLVCASSFDAGTVNILYEG